MNASLFPTIAAIGPVPTAAYCEAFNAGAQALRIPLVLNPAGARSADDVAELVDVPDENSWRRYGIRGRFPGRFTEGMIRDARRVVGQVEEERRRLVLASSLHHEWHARKPSSELWDKLNPAERRAVEIFAEQVLPAIDTIEARQQDHHALAVAAAMRDADDRSRKIFARVHRDTLVGAPFQGNPYGSLHPAFPGLPNINGMITPTLSLEEFAEITKGMPADDEFLRPTTVVTEDGGTIPLPLHPDFRVAHEKLAKTLTEITALNVQGSELHPKLILQLKAWAQFFTTGTAPDEAAAVQATIDAGEDAGLLRVHLGPSESYWADNIKFPYVLMVGIRDPQLAAILAEKQRAFFALEDSLRGIAHYAPRTLSPRGGFADPVWFILTGGFVSTYQYGEPAALNFPNHDYPGVEGSNRIIMLEVAPSYAPQAETVLARLLARDTSSWNSIHPLMHFVTAHESGHMIGPPRSHVVPAGGTMGMAFGNHWGDADEPKADLTAVAQVSLLVRQQIAELQAVWNQVEGLTVTREEAEDILFAALGMNLSKRYRGKDMFNDGKLHYHSYGHMIQVGMLFKSGALRLEDDKFEVDFDRMMSAYHELWRNIIGYQASGNVAGFLAYSSGLVAEIPDEADALILAANKDMRDYFVVRTLPQ